MSDSSPSRVTIVTQQLGDVRTGVGTYANHLVAGLRDRGWPVTVVTFRKCCGSLSGIDYVPVDRRRFDPTPGAWWSLSVGAQQKLATIDADVVLFADAREAYHYRGTTPSIGMVHDAYAVDGPRSLAAMRADHPDWLKRSAYYAFLRRVEPIAYRKLTVLMANADDTRKKVVDAYGLDAARARTVRLGLRTIGAVEPAAVAGNPSVLFVGSNFYRKGLDTLIGALGKLQDGPQGAAPGRDPVVHVVGHDPNRSRIESLALARGVAARVVFHGRLDQADLLRMMAGATMLCMPSRTEGYGLVFLEAMAVGTPVIGGRAGGTRELIRDGENGLLVAPGDVDALASAIEHLHGDPVLTRRLFANGRDTVAAHGVDAMVDGTIAALGSARATAVTRRGLSVV